MKYLQAIIDQNQKDNAMFELPAIKQYLQSHGELIELALVEEFCYENIDLTTLLYCLYILDPHITNGIP